MSNIILYNFKKKKGNFQIYLDNKGIWKIFQTDELEHSRASSFFPRSFLPQALNSNSGFLIFYIKTPILNLLYKAP